MAVKAVGCEDVICLKYAQGNWVISLAWTALLAVCSVCNSRSNGLLFIRTDSKSFECFVDHHNVYATYFSLRRTAFLQKYF